MSARNGKIARLPRSLREQLNERLDRSEESPSLLAWLNALPLVQEVLREDFDGVPVSKQNLSEWRRGGFQEWLGRRDLLEGARDMAGLSDDMEEEGSRAGLADDMALVLAARVGTLITNWNGEVDAKFEAKSRVLSRLGRTVVQLQRSLHRASLEELEVERIVEEKEKAEREEIKEKLVGRWFDVLKASKMAGLFGGGVAGRKIADYIQEVRRGNLEADLDIAPTDLCGDGQPFVRPAEPAKPTRKSKTARRPGKTKPDNVDKPLEETEMDVAREGAPDEDQSGSVKVGKTAVAESKEEGLDEVHNVHHVHSEPADDSGAAELQKFT